MTMMVKNLLKYKLLFVCTITQVLELHITQASNVPVLFWSGDSSTNLANPLHRTSRLEFEAILTKHVGIAKFPIIVFVKDNFCVEDIKHHKESLQQLHSAGSLTYLTSVESALSVFENLSSYNITMGDELESVAEGQLVLVQINDLHVIPEVYRIIQESSPNVIVALTGKSCSYSYSERSKRAIGIRNTTDHFIIDKKTILLYADENPSIKFNTDKYNQLKYPTYIRENVNHEEYNLTMIFKGFDDATSKIQLIARFQIRQGYYNFIGFMYEADGNSSKQFFLKSNRDILFPFNFSYHCMEETVFNYKDNMISISLKISNLQVQMDAEKFADAYDCVGFMSIPIWTGIFVTTILSLIMIWALTMIMDIRTMDRFDDPKGKTITISTQE